jgi:hypothetical protein
MDSNDLINIVKPTELVPMELYINAHEFLASPKSFQFSEDIQFQGRSIAFVGTTLITTQSSVQLLKWIGSKGKSKTWELIYKASQDGFDNGTFHSKCDFKGETITVIQSKTGHIFGKTQIKRRRL